MKTNPFPLRLEVRLVGLLDSGRSFRKHLYQVRVAHRPIQDPEVGMLVQLAGASNTGKITRHYNEPMDSQFPNSSNTFYCYDVVVETDSGD